MGARCLGYLAYDAIIDNVIIFGLVLIEALGTTEHSPFSHLEHEAIISRSS